ncbi:ABC transporter ATP-binding protein [Patescibacteria group bacterium]|nr:ABC transporter ATP-binding protein [Patescibacteria group bacterium]MBU1967260.1 ABC transporter ATP-binding protein [Patescibacteria group bacterium]MBU2543032.1 ABC transporter ATP-binding protein [Patescibacteria group bacterium]
MPLLKLSNVSQHYQIGDITIKALDNLSFTIEEGEFVAVMGPSGSGKSTFLQVASMLAEPSSGSIMLKDKDVTHYDEKDRAHLRNKEIGFVFQQFNLLAKTSALENVALPLLYAGDSRTSRYQKAKEMLGKVNLSDRIHNAPNQLSGGQQQRVAIARALVNNPSILFADEPTGNLDSKSGADIKDLFKKLHQEGKTIIMVTHEKYISKIAKRLITLKDGRIVSDRKT